jgi:hypothetical protein
VLLLQRLVHLAPWLHLALLWLGASCQCLTLCLWPLLLLAAFVAVCQPEPAVLAPWLPQPQQEPAPASACCHLRQGAVLAAAG